VDECTCIGNYVEDDGDEEEAVIRGAADVVRQRTALDWTTGRQR